MTLKINKAAGKKTKKQVVVADAPGFTHSESKLIDQLEAKKKVKHEKVVEEDSGKVGNMFKKKKKTVDAEENIEEEEEKVVVKKEKKSKKMEVDNEDFEVVKPSKKSKKTEETESTSDVVIPGFSAPKVAPKRKHEGEEVNGKKAKKAVGEQTSVFKKKEKEALKVERKTKENENRYLLSVKAKKLWEELRREDTTKERQLSISADLYGLIKTHAAEVSEKLMKWNVIHYKFYN